MINRLINSNVVQGYWSLVNSNNIMYINSIIIIYKQYIVYQL